MERERKDKEVGGEIVVPGKFWKWLDNFWYHYKWTVIIVSFFAVVFGVCFVQCTQNVQVNIPVVYAGGYHQTGENTGWTEADRRAVKEVLTALYQRSTGDTEQNLGFLTHTIYTEDELRAMATEMPTVEGESEKFSPYAFQAAKQNNLAELDSFSNYLGTGECSVWMVSEYVYREKMHADLLMPLSELYGEEIPGSAYDDYAIRLGDTALYQYYDAFRVLPEDTLLVLSRKWVMGGSSDAETYQAYTTLYRAMVDFKAP